MSRRVQLFATAAAVVMLSGCLSELSLGLDTDDSQTESEAEADTNANPTMSTTAAGDCSEGLLLCDEECIDPRDDDFHCGECFNQCTAGTGCENFVCARPCDEGCDDVLEVCVEGLCECRRGLISCGGDCVDLRSDPDNCGNCGEVCPPFGACGAGECRDDACPGFGDACDGACVDVLSDALHCGVCDRACAPEDACIDGECVAADPIDVDLCDACPCEVQCDPQGLGACCFDEFAGVDSCVDLEACP